MMEHQKDDSFVLDNFRFLLGGRLAARRTVFQYPNVTISKAKNAKMAKNGFFWIFYWNAFQF